MGLKPAKAFFGLFFSFLLSDLAELAIKVNLQQHSLDIQYTFTKISTCLITGCFLFRILSDQQASYTIKSSTLLFAISHFLQLIMMLLRQYICQYLFFSLQLAFSTLGQIFYYIMISSTALFMLQANYTGGDARANVYRKIVLLFLLLNFSKLISQILYNIITQYINIGISLQFWVIFSIQIILLVGVLVLNEVYSMYRLEQYIYGMQITIARNMKHGMSFFELLNSPNSLKFYYYDNERERGEQEFSPKRMLIFINVAIVFYEMMMFCDKPRFNQKQYINNSVLVVLDLIVLMSIVKLDRTRSFYRYSLIVMYFQLVGIVGQAIVDIILTYTEDAGVMDYIEIAIQVYNCIILCFSQVFCLQKVDTMNKYQFKKLVYQVMFSAQLSQMLYYALAHFQGDRHYISTLVCLLMLSVYCVLFQIYYAQGQKRYKQKLAQLQEKKLAGDRSSADNSIFEGLAAEKGPYLEKQGLLANMVSMTYTENE